jgi:hypothetical protein
MAHCEKCGYELPADAERLLAELRATLARSDPQARVDLRWVEPAAPEPAAIDWSGPYPKGFARRRNGDDEPAAVDWSGKYPRGFAGKLNGRGTSSAT